MGTEQRRKKLTQEEVAAAAAEAREYIVWDTEVTGFGLRVRPNGTKSFLVKYRVNGQVRKPNIKAPEGRREYTAAEARREAKRIIGEGAGGMDRRAEALAEKAKAAEAQAPGNTLAAAAARFLDLYARQHCRPRTVQAYERAFSADVLPAWGDRPVTEISRKNVSDLLAKIVRRGAPYQANRTLAYLRALLNWLVDQGDLPANPVAKMRAPGKEASRERALGPTERNPANEIKAVWGAFEGLGFPFGPAFKLMLLTGQRVGEVAGMHRDEVDLDRAVWIIPGERAKNGRRHEVPLSPVAVEIIRALPAYTVPGFGPYLFGQDGRRAPSGFSRAKANVDKAVARATAAALRAGKDAPEVAPWQLRDLRRTVATGLAEVVKARVEVIGAVLNHTPRATMGITATYNVGSYGPEKRAALNAWADYLGGLVR